MPLTSSNFSTPLTLLDDRKRRVESGIYIYASKGNEEIMKYLQEFEQAVCGWAQVSIHPHRFGGLEFRFGNAEIGHVHTNGIVDIPFPRAVRDALLAEGLAEEHHWVPNSGWVTFRIRDEHGLGHALWLFRLSYLRYLLKTQPQPQKLLEQESEKLHLNERLKSLLEPFLRKAAKEIVLESVSAE